MYLAFKVLNLRSSFHFQLVCAFVCALSSGAMAKALAVADPDADAIAQQYNELGLAGDIVAPVVSSQHHAQVGLGDLL